MWFGKKAPSLWVTDAEGRRHLTEDGKRKFDQWEAEAKIQRADCQVHILDPAQAGARIETWLIDAGDGRIDRDTYNRLRDDRGHLHALVHYKAGRREVYIVAKPLWDQALEAFK
jgi:hypothetical protein